ncbi:VOC family protein [Acanthopleuribacter pedis]|uniref:VOC family protein n=1 Tax=Acanthopleuribacter pedis TaxID=442870 RepID=A0A8J7QBE3_9BACT|nr:VOC family protein [Acanthopleuribacter pedis]MBO1320584.1 VOC family protein [Acanthopleuribacter pedis]
MKAVLSLALFLVCSLSSFAMDQPLQTMTYGVISEKIEASRDFYAKHFGFKVVFQNEWYIHMVSDTDARFQIAFMKPNHPTQPPVFQPGFAGKGLFITLEVKDVKALYKKIKAAGVTISYELADEAWGERHFAIVDPNGVALNISQRLETVSETYKDGFVKPETEKSAPQD